MITIKKQKDRNGEFLGSYLGDNGRYYPEHELYDEDGNALFEFSITETTPEEVAIIAIKAAEVEAQNNLDLVRKRRNKLLADTDFWAFQDTPEMTAEQSAYRQALRDITNTYTSLDDVVWPTKP